MRLPVLLALGLLVGACSSSPEWVSSASGSLCSLDVGGGTRGNASVDVVIVVDDSPSARPAREMLRKRTLGALRGLVTERDPNDPTSLPAVHDLHVLVRGVSTSYERRVAYLANTPDNAWTTPQGEARDAEPFLAACESALGDLPEGTEAPAFVARVSDLRLGEDFLRDGRVVVLFATAHDDSSGGAGLPLREGEHGFLVELSVLADDRLLGASAPSGPRLCGTFARSSFPEWDPARTPVPRLAALVKQTYEGQLSIVCSDAQEAADLLRDREIWVLNACFPPRDDGKCTLLIAPPVLGDDARCERPELGLAPATADEHTYAKTQLDDSLLAGRPLCRMTELESASSPGEGWSWRSDWCGLHFTPWAQPVGGSSFLFHCVAPKCGPP